MELHKKKRLSCFQDKYKEKAINPLSVNFTKLSNTLKQFVGKLPTICLSVFDDFVGLALKGLKRPGRWKMLVSFTPETVLINGQRKIYYWRKNSNILAILLQQLGEVTEKQHNLSD